MGFFIITIYPLHHINLLILRAGHNVIWWEKTWWSEYLYHISSFFFKTFDAKLCVLILSQSANLKCFKDLLFVWNLSISVWRNGENQNKQWWRGIQPESADVRKLHEHRRGRNAHQRPTEGAVRTHSSDSGTRYSHCHCSHK